MSDEGFSREYRILTSSQFEHVFNHGGKVGSRLMLLRFIDNGLGHPRLGFVVSRRFGNAVTRNRFRRRVRDVFRRNKERFGSLDIVVLPSKGMAIHAATFEEIKGAVLALADKALAV